MSHITTKTIAILGAGFGGLRAAKLLSAKFRRLGLLSKYEIVLADRNEHHTYTPLLYEVATTFKETANLAALHGIAAYNLRALTKNWGITLLIQEAVHVDPITGAIRFRDGHTIAANFIILALGSETNYFSIPGLKEHSLSFKTFVDAIRIRDAVWEQAASKDRITVVVGGAGSTGVELAGEFKNLCGEFERGTHGCTVSVKLIEASESVLPGFDRRTIAKTTRRLNRLGVEILAGHKILKAAADHLVLDTGEKIDFDVFVWAGGVKATALPSQMPIRTEERARAIVGEGMECLPQTPDLKLASRVYALGDAICFYDPVTKKPIPGVAPAALAQATVAAHNIIEEIKAAETENYAPRLSTYKPRRYPYVIPVGGKYAVSKIGPVLVSGFPAWILKGLVELKYLVSIMPLGKALGIWFKGLAVFLRNKRLG